MCEDDWQTFSVSIKFGSVKYYSRNFLKLIKINGQKVKLTHALDIIYHTVFYERERERERKGVGWW
jgi:hypothetical protein